MWRGEERGREETREEDAVSRTTQNLRMIVGLSFHFFIRLLFPSYSFTLNSSFHLSSINENLVRKECTYLHWTDLERK